MTPALSLFRYNDRAVRAVVIDGQPWFVGKDVAELLGYPWQPARDDHHCRIRSIHRQR